MRNRVAHRPAWPLMLALLGVARTAGAQDDTVRVACDALSTEDAAQVEARTRATLLTTDDRSLSVRIDCVADQATVRVIAGDRTETTAVTVSGENARDALLAAVERTLEALERGGEPSASETTPPPAPVPAPGAKAAVVTPPKPAAAAERAPPSPERRAASSQIAAGALAELWNGTLALGARLAAERRLRPWSLGAALGWLTSLGGDDPFRADELHAFAYGAFEEERTTGLSGSLGAGVSVLTVGPDPEVVAQSSPMLALVMFELGVSRPVRFGRASIIPALDLRLFPGRREVNVDSAHRLVLPPLCPSLFLGFGYEI